MMAACLHILYLKQSSQDAAAVCARQFWLQLSNEVHSGHCHDTPSMHEVPFVLLGLMGQQDCVRTIVCSLHAMRYIHDAYIYMQP